MSLLYAPTPWNWLKRLFMRRKRRAYVAKLRIARGIRQ